MRNTHGNALCTCGLDTAVTIKITVTQSHAGGDFLVSDDISRKGFWGYDDEEIEGLSEVMKVLKERRDYYRARGHATEVIWK